MESGHERKSPKGLAMLGLFVCFVVLKSIVYARRGTGGGSGGGRVRGGGGGMCEKDGREDRKSATAARRSQRSTAVRSVGQLAVGAAPMRAWYERRWEQYPDLSCKRVVLVTRGRDFSCGATGGAGARRSLLCGAEKK